MDIKKIQQKVLETYILKGLSVKNIVSDISDFNEDEKEYASKRMVFKIEDLSEKEKAVFNVLQLLGDLGVEDSFEESEETKEMIKKLQEILMFIQS